MMKQKSVAMMSTLGVLAPLKEAILPAFEASAGIGTDVDFAPTNVLVERIDAGCRAQVLVAISETVRGLADQGVLSPDGVRDIAVTSVGIAKRAGSGPVDISSEEALIGALLAARSIAISRTGASGIFFRGLLARLGVAERVLEKAVIIPQGLTADLLLRGEADLAVQQMSELRAVSGVDVIGPLPRDLNRVTTFTAAMFADRVGDPGVGTLMDFLTGELACRAYLAGGLALPEPAP